MDTPGIHDPLWYEALVGLRYVVDLFDPASGVESVTFQHPGVRGIDDVVVRRTDGGPSTYVQVRHVQTPDTLTQRHLLAPDGDGPCLLAAMAAGWSAEVAHGPCVAVLHTNRTLGNRAARSPTGTLRPPLTKFLPWLSEQLAKITRLDELVVPDAWRDVWKEWLDALSVVEGDGARYDFLRALRVSAGEPSLDDLDERLLRRIGEAFGVAEGPARTLRTRLLAATRLWATTSRRDRPAVTLRDAYAQLSDEKAESTGVHRIAPPSPFFPSRATLADELARRLRDETDAVVFLTGEPGCGKSSTVSFLANRREPVVDVRFHAFVPLDPQGSALPAHDLDVTSGRVLWGDLLSQIRDANRESLSSLRIPFANEFLDMAGRRGHVLRVAAEIAKSRARPFVIAIDGLDHSARAKSDAPVELLDSIPSPDQVPEGVRLLIAGQPPADDGRYPSWLRIRTPGVHRLDMRPLLPADVKSLAGWHEKSLWGRADEVARLVLDASKGNALAAVFAMHEASLSASFEEFERRLSQRQLSSGLTSYYDAIWTAGLRQLARTRPLLVRRVENCLALAHDPITPADLSAFFDEVTEGEAGELLRALRPLVTERGGGFALLHDNVRVHLRSRTAADAAFTAKVASTMATYYLSKKNPDRRTRHSSGFRLLGDCGRSAEWGDVVDPEWILEGWACGRSLTELREQLEQALEVTTAGKANWARLYNLACAAMTVRQLEASLQWSSAERETVDAKRDELPTVLASERAVLQRGEWSQEVLIGVLADVLWISGSDVPRASALAMRWFAGVPWTEVLELPYDARFKARAPRQFDQHAGHLFELWGRVAFATEVGGEPPTQDLSEALERAWASFHLGLVTQGLVAERTRRHFQLTAPTTRWQPRRISEVIRASMQKSEATAVVIALRRLRTWREAFSSAFRVQVAAWAVCSDARAHLREWIDDFTSADPTTFCKTLHEQYRQHLSSGLEDTWALAAFALVAAYAAPGAVVDEQARALTSAHFANRNDERTRQTTLSLVRASGWVGRVLLTRDDPAGGHSPGKAAITETCRRLLGLRHGRPWGAPYEDLEVSHHLLRALVRGARDQPDVAGWVTECFVDVFEDDYLGPARAEVWRWLLERGRDDELRAWLVSLIGTEGAAWHLPIAERAELVESMCDLGAGSGFDDIIAPAKERLAWSWTSYVGRKDYSLEEPAAWAAEISEHGGRARCAAEFTRLGRLSEIATELGDNRSRTWIAALLAGTTSASADVEPDPVFESAAAWRAECIALELRMQADRIDDSKGTKEALLRCCRLAVSGKAFLDAADVDRAIGLFAARRPPEYGWTFDGSTCAVEVLAEILSDAQVWKLMRQHVERLRGQERTIWVRAVATDLDALCRVRAKTVRELQAGLDGVLSTHEAWLTGGRRFAPPGEP